MFKSSKLFLSLFICLMVSVVTLAKEKVAVQYIAVHFGNAENEAALNKADFPAFAFYQADGDLIAYKEDQKLMGNPTYMSGWYGKVPETMAFTANYRGENAKNQGFPYENGAVFVLDKNGTIAYQLPPERFNPENYGDKYSAVYSAIKGTVKKMANGKEQKALKANKCTYLKKSPVGQLEASKGSKIDKSGEGITGWPVPSLELITNKGEKVDLKDLAKGKVTVLVFYTLNGATWQQGDTDGKIKQETPGEKLLTVADFQKKQNAEFEDKAAAGDAKGLLKMAAKEAFSSENAMVSIREGKQLSDKEKASLYKRFTQHLEMIQDMAD